MDLEELVATAEKAKSTESIAFALYTASQVKTDNAISVIKRYLNDNRKVRIGTGSFVIAKAVGELAWRFLFEAAPKEVEKICSMKSQLRQE